MANTAFNHDPALTVAASNTTAGAAVKWVASKNLGESLIILDSGGNGRIGLAGDLDLITLTTDTVTVAGTVAATTLTGAGSGITALAAGNIASGTIATARLGSGTANNSVFLRGDNTWAAAGATDIGARVYKTVGQNTSNDTVTTVTWNAESYDTDNIHDNSTNNGAILGAALVGAISQQAAASVSGLRGNNAVLSNISKQLTDIKNFVLKDDFKLTPALKIELEKIAMKLKDEDFESKSHKIATAMNILKKKHGYAT